MKDSISYVRLESSLSLLVGIISYSVSTISSISLRTGVLLSAKMFLVAFQTLLAACLNHILYYKL